MSDVVQIATAFFALIGTMFSAYMAFKLAQLNQKQATAAVNVARVADDLKTGGERSDRKLDQIIRVADGALGVQMKIAADALMVAADKTGDPNLRAVADHAERAYRDHEANLAAYGEQP